MGTANEQTLEFEKLIAGLDDSIRFTLALLTP